jgi:hypothetical protein
MPPMMVAIRNFNGGRKLLNYPKYTKNSDLDACVRVQTSNKNELCHPRG